MAHNERPTAPKNLNVSPASNIAMLMRDGERRADQGNFGNSAVTVHGETTGTNKGCDPLSSSVPTTAF